MRDLWYYANTSNVRLRLCLHPSGTARGRHVDLRPGEEVDFDAPVGSWVSTVVLPESASGVPKLCEQARVEELCEPLLSVLACAFGVGEEEILGRWEAAGRPSWSFTPRKRSGPGPSFVGTEREPASPTSEATTSRTTSVTASFEMLYRGGLHARPAVLIQKALTDLRGAFEYVEAAHGDRIARMFGSQSTKQERGPAFWVLLLRLEAYRGGEVVFTVSAEEPAQAECVLKAVAGVLGRPVPERLDYWRELGFEGWCRTYLKEAEQPEVREIQDRYLLFGKGKKDSGPEPPAGSPMARMIRRKGLKEQDERVYVRFGDPPSEELSHCFIAQRQVGEVGVSVFSGRKLDKNCYVIELPTRILSLMLAWCLGQNRPAYVVSGRKLLDEHGAAGEPLLKEVSIVKEIPADASLTTAPGFGIRYRDKELKKWAARRRKGDLRPRDSIAENEHLERTWKEAEKDGLETLGGDMDGGVIYGAFDIPGPEGWPEFSHLRLNKPLGLAAGVYEVEDHDGVRYAVREAVGHSFRPHFEEQAVAERCYQALGLSVAPSVIYEPKNGSSAERTRIVQSFVEGRSFLNLEYVKNVKLREGLAAGFAADALLGNKTVVGAAKDKVILGVDGRVYRLDTRGALRYFWNGQKKSHELFGPEVRELETMRSTMTSSGEVFGNLTDWEVAQQIEEMILPNEDKLLDVLSEAGNLRDVLGSRVRYMEKWAKSVQPMAPDVKERIRQDTSEAIPDMASLIVEVERCSTYPGKKHGIHGAPHWQRVAVCSYEIARRMPEVDPLFVFLFALFHDAMRENDAEDEGHGERGADLAAELIPDYPKLDQLLYAVREHTSGVTTDDPTVGACWDADRLNLWRIGIRPDPNLLCTEVAKDAGLRAFARGLEFENHTWEMLLDDYGLRGA